VLPLLLAAAGVAFQPGETLAYEVRYLGLTAGEITLSVREESGRPDRLRLHLQGRTLNSADSLFRVRADSFCVVERAAMLPVWCRAAYSTRREDRRREVRYDRAAGKVQETLLDGGKAERHIRSLGPEPAGTLPLEVGRTVLFGGWRGEKRVRVECLPEVVEVVATPAGPQRALRLAVHVREKYHPEQGDGGTVWLSDDPRRVPLRMSFDAPLGTLEVVLVSASGLLPGPLLTAAGGGQPAAAGP
jgi:hypothetical protein